MSCCDNSPGMMPVADAIQRIIDTVSVQTESVSIPLENALDRILASDVTSSIDVPGHDNSAMDGYALRSEDLKNTCTLSQVGKSFAGEPFKGTVEVGRCVRIMTGAVIPKGADCVVMQENTTAAQNEQITIHKNPQAGENIRRAGEDIAVGTTVLEKGTRLSPIDIGLLASIGIDRVDVLQPITLGIFSTGDELRLPGSELDSGCIYDSNRFVVRAILQRLGVTILDLGIIPDQPEALQAAFEKATRECDGIISSGGVSVGEADYTKDILEKLGEVSFWKVAMKPGKPFAFGTLNCDGESAFFFGLPGNPVSATVTFHQLALPAIHKMMGATPETPITLPLATIDKLKKRPGRADFQRGKLVKTKDGKLSVESTGKQGSGILTSLSKADCYMVLEQDRSNCETGDKVNVQLFDRWID